MRISALQRLTQSAEAREDPLVAGMVESLMTQLKRAVANRDAGLLEAADTEAKLEPDQVVVRGELASVLTKQRGKKQASRCCTTDVCLSQSVNKLYNNNKMAKLVLIYTAWF